MGKCNCNRDRKHDRKHGKSNRHKRNSDCNCHRNKFDYCGIGYAINDTNYGFGCNSFGWGGYGGYGGWGGYGGNCCGNNWYFTNRRRCGRRGRCGGANLLLF